MDPEFEKTYYGIPLVYKTILASKTKRIPWKKICRLIVCNGKIKIKKPKEYHATRANFESVKRKYKSALLKRDRCCVYCGSKEKLTIDHIVPIRYGGSNDISNLVVACSRCNRKKYFNNIILFCDKNGHKIPKAIFGLRNEVE